MSVRSKLKKQTRFVKELISKGGRKPTSVKKYTGEAFAPINTGLLEGTRLDRRCKDILDDLDAIFRDIPPTDEEIIVYRGVTTKHSFGVLAGFISTSYDYGTALSFADDKKQCCVFIIKVPPGAKVLPVEDLSVNPTEGEILLPRSGHFTATGTTYRNGMECFYLDLVISKPVVIPSSTKPSTLKRHVAEESSVPNKDQIVDLLIKNTTQDDIEMFGVEGAISITASSVEKLIRTPVDEDMIRDAIAHLKTRYGA
jgi:hypothetical protein